MPVTVTFQPSDIAIDVPEGTLISEAAVMAGITDLHLPCGGRGTCGKCLVAIRKPDDDKPRTVQACTTPIRHDLIIKLEPRQHTAGSCIVADADFENRARESFVLSPICRKISVVVPGGTIDDNYADFELLERELFGVLGSEGILRCPRDVLQALAAAHREKGGTVTVTLGSEGEFHEIVAIESGDTTGTHYGIACDLGTTTVALRLVDLASGRVLAKQSDYNGQIARGGDVISRIEYGRNGMRRGELRTLALETVNRLISGVCRAAGVDSGSVTSLSVAGNSTMIHLFLGLPAQHLREHPYVPTVKRVPLLTAEECGVAVNPHAKVFVAPGVGSYVGGDITAGLLCTDLAAGGGELSLFIDIGTNGEIVIGDGEFLLTTACSAGPAFEGSGISCGMRAAPGAIDSFTIDNGGESVDWTVIGEGFPEGVCGSGLISLLGEMFKAGVIDAGGKISDSAPASRLVTIEGTRGFVLVDAVANRRAIVVTEADIDNLIRTKAAIYAACDRLLAAAGLGFGDVGRFLVAGGFGRFIDVEDAIRIGLFPAVDRSRFTYLGNTALAGATFALLSRESRERLAELSSRMTYVELSNDPQYMDAYTAALFLPHTDRSRFERL